ncbi:trehalose-phosphatase [Microbacterium sp. P01]|uniref:trehalose-phosphatase n=1 Tax=Microbacterium sp. P01 TaxID=3366261 RepID=UPI00366C896D
MTPLPPETVDTLRPLAETAVLLVALDFDGTLAPFEDEPMKARMLPESRAAVESLFTLPDTVVALVSGRSLSDLEQISEHTEDSAIVLAGSHGAEFWIPGEGLVTPTEEARETELRDTLRHDAERELAGFPGVWVEPKTYGFGIHTRTASADDGERAWQYADALVAQHAPHWRRRTGHNIVEYSFRQEGKDAAVAVLRERLSATAVLFAGDDVTDEDAMKALRVDDLGIRVGGGQTAAALRVSDIEELAAVLSALAEMRAARRE